MNINKLFTRLSIGALLSTAITVAANPAQAVGFRNLTTVNFDEVNVGLEAEDNPLYGGDKIDTLWSSYGLEMDSSVNELWLYDTSKRGRDNDLLTGNGQYKHQRKTIKYDSIEQNKVLIIQEDNGDKKAKHLRPDDHVGGSIKFDFTDTNNAGEEVGVLFDSIGLLDFDENKLPEFMVKFAGQNELVKFKFNEKDRNIVKQAGEGNSETLTLANHQYITEMTRQRATKNGKETDENSFREYNFDFGGQKVTEFYVNLPGSGAITGLNYYRQNTKKLARKVPEPTSILGLVAISGLAASSLKRKRKTSDI